MKKPITAILLGAGGRGMFAYGNIALTKKDDIKFVAVAEPDEKRRGEFAKLHGIKPANAFSDWKDMLSKPKMADCAFICTQDKMHFEPTMKTLELGYHVLLEKPMATTAKECILLGEAAKKYNRLFSICHVLRYTDFFATLKNIIDSGKIGDVVTIQHSENVAFWHYAHSYVRGLWNVCEESGPHILTKSCHDMDILLYLLGGSPCTYIASTGSLKVFKPENAPEGAQKRCIEKGKICPCSKDCVYYAPDTYLSKTENWNAPFQFMLTLDKTPEGRMKALENSRSGKCVYYAGNDVVDNQAVCMSFENGVNATFTLTAFTQECTRIIRILGSKGEIYGDMDANKIEYITFIDGKKTKMDLKETVGGHGGGDIGLVEDFINLVRSGGKIKSRTAAADSVMSHVMAFAAEESRVSKKMIKISDYIKEKLNI